MVVKDIGASIKTLAALGLATGATAASTATGIVIDRLSTGQLDSHYQSCKLSLLAFYSRATTGTAGTWTATPRLQHADSTVSTAFANFSTGGALALAAAGSTGTAQITQSFLDIDLTTAKRYLRMQCVLGSRTSVAGNTYNVMGAITFGGADVLPAS